MQKMKFLLLAMLFLVIINVVSAAEPGQVIVNSEDWKDVYSSMLFGSLTGRSVSFLVSNKHATLILESIPQSTHLWAISSKKTPYVAGYKAIMESKGYSSEEFTYENVNLELAKRIEVTNFIVIDKSYGYNAISVAPYAVLTNSYVLFADSTTIGEVSGFLSARKVDKIIIYGHVDREVKDALAQYTPEIINKDGDRFLNNIEIVKKYRQVKGVNQVILTNGEFIEKEIMSGVEPVVFIGTNNVPNVVREFIQGSDIQVGVLIGNELVGTATFIRRQIGISVFVKFAQGARAPKGTISQVEALDMFYLPVYTLNLEVDSIKYNKATNQLEVTLKNTQDQAVYFIGTYTLTDSSGKKQTVGDIGSTFIDGNEIKTMIYSVEQMAEGLISADLFVIYGESSGSLEKEIRKTLQVDTVEVKDNCNIAVNKVMYNQRSKYFTVAVENVGEVDCYVDIEMPDIIVAGEKQTFSMDGTEAIASKKTKDLRVKAELTEEDVLDNEKVKVKAYYGERQNNLVRVYEGIFTLTIKSTDYLFYSLLVVIIILIVLIILKRRKDKEKNIPV